MMGIDPGGIIRRAFRNKEDALRKALKIGAAVVVALVLVAALLVFSKLRSLGTPEFKQGLLDQARSYLGVPVEAKSLDIALLEGVRLEGVTIANPPGFPGPLLTADAFVLRYSLWPLLRGRLEIRELVARKPALAVVSDARGVFNYEKLGGGTAASASPSAGAPSSTGGGAPSFLRRIVISRLAMEDGGLKVAEGKAVFLRAEGVGFESAIAVAGREAEGKGSASIKSLVLGESLFLRDVKAPMTLTAEAVRLSPVSGRLAGGAVKGDIRLRLKPSLQYTMSLEVEGAAVETLLKEAGAAPGTRGKLKARASLSGTAGLPTVKGKGAAEVQDCALSESRVFKLLAEVLQLPELAEPRFETCRMEFDLAGVRARTPVLVLKGPALELSGHGTYNLTSSALDYDLTLVLPQKVYHKLTARAVRGAFKEREDGSASLDFKVTGTSTDPKVDLAARLAKAGAAEVVKGGLGRIFGKKDKKN